jgi:ABC-type transport system involved in cytochrome c biogenesis permease subunit
MKRHFPWIIFAFAALWIASGWRVTKVAPGEFDTVALGKIPVLVGGRVKPLDTVARNSLVIIHGRQTLRLDDGKILDADRWLADTLFNGAVADKYPAFVINNPDVLGMFGWRQETRKFFSFAEISPFLAKIEEDGQKVEPVPSASRTPYQTAVFNLRNALILFQRLKNSIQLEGEQDFSAGIDAYEKAIPAGIEATMQQQKGEKFDREKLAAFASVFARFESLSGIGYILAVPPAQPDGATHGDWLSTGASLMHSLADGAINPVAKSYAQIGDDWRAGDATAFNRDVAALFAWMAEHQPRASGRAQYEFLFNNVAPFYQSMTLYVLAFLLVCGSWLGWSRTLNRSAFLVLLLALAVHTFGLVTRMILQGRPPVTNLYSSAIFIGWGTVILGLVLERIYRDGIGMACASIIGFITLIIAHHLAASGDTLEMLQAVLDTNIWLATHVVVVTLGYSAMFFAGMLAMFYVVRGVFTRSMTKDSAASLTRMVYGVVCFATLFSFVGTVLGGIWADQSWGRFWGWDPKENGALLIVLWCALVLHARWGGFVRQRGLMVMVLFGNVITSFSWFGVNMLGVGLHSYGFMQKAFPWLVGFVVSQLALMAVASMPLNRWRSFAQPPRGAVAK